MHLVSPYPRQPATAEEEAYAFLLDAICKGRYRTGDRLIAEDIANDIGMSRMPVREAFRRLAAEGLPGRRRPGEPAAEPWRHRQRPEHRRNA